MVRNLYLAYASPASSGPANGDGRKEARGRELAVTGRPTISLPFLGALSPSELFTPFLWGDKEQAAAMDATMLPLLLFY